MRVTTIAALTLTALTLGFVTGRVWERAVRAWSDYKARKAEVPILYATARLLSVKALGWVLLSAAVAAWSLHSLASKGP